MGVRFVTAQSIKTQALDSDMGVRLCSRDESHSFAKWVSDLSQLSPQKHKHYIVMCINGVCEVLVTITVTTNLCTKGVRLSQLSPQDTCTIQ